MAFLDFHFFSETLGLTCSAHVILPQATTLQIGMTGGKKRNKYPTLYLLHGLSDDHTIWTRRTSIERYAANLPLMVVMPDGERGFYTDAKEGPKFQTEAERAGRCIGGLSMGGYGAVKLALKHPDMFVSANSHSGALAWAHKPL